MRDMRGLPVWLTLFTFIPFSAQAQFLTHVSAEEPHAARVDDIPARAYLTAPAAPEIIPKSQVRPQIVAAAPVAPLTRAADLVQPVAAPQEVPASTPRQAVPLTRVAELVAAAPIDSPASDMGAQATGSEEAPVHFTANDMQYDETGEIVQARGAVEIEQEGRILRADHVRYDVRSDKVQANGHVSLTDISGDVHRADKAVFTNQLKDGEARNISSTLNDGASFFADSGQRFEGKRFVMEDAVYTACKLCTNKKTGQRKDPAWQIKAENVEHDQESRQISYDDATFEVYGFPVMYLPYFSHADGSIDRQSGFLAPSGGYKSDLGVYADTRYYWDIAPDQDATLGVMAFTQSNPLAHMQWRKRWENASLQLDGGVTYSERTDSESGVERLQDEETRGHVLATGLWNINELWRAGTDVQWASDEQYMRQYDFIDEDVLTSDLYVERFEGRNYIEGHLTTFQDVRVRENQEDQPEVAPEIAFNFQGDPGAVPLVGGSWFIDSSYLGLRRDGDDEQDMDRLSFAGGWKRHLLSDTGLVTDVRLSAQQDVYHVRDLTSATAGSGLSTEASEVRFTPQAHIVTRYPLAKPLRAGGHILVEPLAALTAAPNIDVTDNIPNEDSQDVQIDAHNLFNADRFPGIDRVEDQSRVTYGLRTGWYKDAKNELRLFTGQSYRFDGDDNPFPDGSGLSQQSSDVVGEIATRIDGRYDMSYRYQLDSRHLNSQRHEVDASADLGRFSLSTQYLFAKALEGTDYNESREQLKGAAGYYWTPKWRQRVGFTQDLGEDPGLREAYTAIDYFGQCVSWSLIGERNLTDDSSGDSDVEIMFRIGLRSLGEFQESGWNGRE